MSIYVYGVHYDIEGDIPMTSGSLPYGTPVFGDRGAWDVFYDSGLHARDIYNNTPFVHAPDNALVGEAPVWDGTKYVATPVLTSGSGGEPLHQHVEADITDLLHNARSLQSVDISEVAPTDGQYLRYDDLVPEWYPSTPSSGSGGDRVIGFSVSGDLETGTSPIRMYSPWSGEITGVLASVGTPPTGEDVIVDIKRNGTSIYSAQANMITILDGDYDSGLDPPDYITLEEGDIFTCEIIQIGSTDPGAYLILQIRARTL